MAFSVRDQEGDMLSEINMIPLIDVMLVLLIVFMITVPVMKHAVSVDLPQASSTMVKDKPSTIQLSVAADGQYHWDEKKISDEQFAVMLSNAAQQTPQPSLHIRGDKEVRYERVAQAMAAAHRAGIQNLGFVTVP
jgi:biopolymer transport protein ExbD